MYGWLSGLFPYALQSTSQTSLSRISTAIGAMEFLKVFGHNEWFSLKRHSFIVVSNMVVHVYTIWVYVVSFKSLDKSV
jgi:hypothetical protein